MNYTDFIFGLAVNTVLQVIALTIKSPASKKKYFAELRKVVTAILTAYPDLLNDPEVAALRSARPKKASK